MDQRAKEEFDLTTPLTQEQKRLIHDARVDYVEALAKTDLFECLECGKVCNVNDAQSWHTGSSKYNTKYERVCKDCPCLLNGILDIEEINEGEPDCSMCGYTVCDDVLTFRILQKECSCCDRENSCRNWEIICSFLCLQKYLKNSPELPSNIQFKIINEYVEYGYVLGHHCEVCETYVPLEQLKINKEISGGEILCNDCVASEYKQECEKYYKGAKTPTNMPKIWVLIECMKDLLGKINYGKTNSRNIGNR